MKSHRKKGKERNGCIAWHQYSCLDSRPWGLKHCLYPASSAKLPAAINSSIPVGISARLSRGARTSPQDFILKTNKQESKKTPLTAKLTKTSSQLLWAREVKHVVGLSLARSFFPGLNLQELGGNVFQWGSFVPLVWLYLKDNQHWPIPHQKGS